MKIQPLVGVLVLVCAGSCGREDPGPESARPTAAIVREIGGALRAASEARLAEARTSGSEPIWRTRFATNMAYLEDVTTRLEAAPAFGAPRHEEADELLRICHEFRQTAECDPKLMRTLSASLHELERASKRLRKATLPG